MNFTADQKSQINEGNSLAHPLPYMKVRISSPKLGVLRTSNFFDMCVLSYRADNAGW